MKTTTAILSLAIVFLNAAMSSATIIATSTFLPGPVDNGASFTFTVRTSITGNALLTGSLATSYGFRVTFNTPAAILSVSSPAFTGGSGVGFFGNFTHVDPPTTGANFVDFVGRNQVGTQYDFNSALNFRDAVFTVSKTNLTSFSATPTAIAYANVPIPPDTLLGGTGFVGNAGTQLSTTYITAVPEPSSVGLLAVAGIFGFGIRMRNWRLKRKSAS